MVAVMLAVVVLATAAPASATPINDKRAQARAVKAQVDALDDKLEIAAEDYNEAHQAYVELSAKVAKTSARLKQIGARTGVLQTSLNTRAESMYRNGPSEVLDVLLGTASFEDFASTWDILNDLNEVEAKSVAELKVLRAEAIAAKAQLDEARAQARVHNDTMKRRKRAVESALSTRKNMLRGLETEIAALEAAARARVSRGSSGRRRGGKGTGWDWGDPKRAPRGEVVAIALKYLGAPYKWAASGPRSFDCSGFTMFVYAQVGVRLPHSSRAQINAGERVSRANLKPGDLVFFGRPIHHVGLYIGGGRMVHSPRTGDVVSIDSISRSNYAGACRP